jgi:deaminated glutathione amidase
MKLRVATCQFAVCDNIAFNLARVLDQMEKAAAARADVAHFSECALSGYGGTDFKSFAGYDWPALKAATEQVLEAARRLRMWVVLGSSHPLSSRHKPHNCLYLIDDRGRIVDRYDKRFCTGDAASRTGDLAHYSPGDHFVTATIRGVRCGLLICHDFRYPEVYRAYAKEKIQLMFHSFHNGNWSDKFIDGHHNIWAVAVPAAMQAAAGANNVWISANNTTRRRSAWASFVVQPDGIIMGRLALHRPGVLTSPVDTTAEFYDPSKAWRLRAISGQLNSGNLVDDAQSRQRTTF